MTAYGFRNNTFTAEEIESHRLNIEKKNAESKGVAYIRLESNAVAGGYHYLYVGTAGALMLASTAPTGTTGEFSNTGGQVGTSA